MAFGFVYWVSIHGRKRPTAGDVLVQEADKQKCTHKHTLVIIELLQPWRKKYIHCLFQKIKVTVCKRCGPKKNPRGKPLFTNTSPCSDTLTQTERGRCASQYIFQCGFLMEFDAVKNRALKRKSHSTSPFGIWTSADRLTFCLLFFSANFLKKFHLSKTRGINVSHHRLL